MRAYLTAPVWALVLLAGLPVGALIALLIVLSGDTVTFAVVFGAAVGLLFGLVIAVGSHRHRRDLRPLLDRLPEPGWTLARAAARDGQVPTDPEVRAAAIELLDLRIRNLRRARTGLVLVLGLNLLIALVNIALGNWWFILAALAWAAGLLERWQAPRRLHRRREFLAAEQTLP
ncbi:hypothetical protein [Kribbella italica]|uniref:Membrane associated rhomboid family serine protease n=1 Tax=Kribbella italica TaxID=1540520 RepID=A0A7W9J7R0_9ACTN|nr:hypothetical protein [Kribbella italica]MBB5836930.1 membrane associated rhomboid family serine protease [Kribbella italica]